jgi:hypothetical protein
VTEELEVLGIVTSRLESASIPYMVTGSTAMNYYAVPRMTRDIDLVAEMLPTDAERVVALFQPDFYLDRDAVRSAIAEHATFNLIHSDLVVKVDIIVRKDSEYRIEEFRRKRRVAIDDMAVFIVSPEDLIISKLDWARESRSETQRADVRNLLRSTGVDRDYLSRWVTRLGLEPLYTEVTAS